MPRQSTHVYYNRSLPEDDILDDNEMELEDLIQNTPSSYYQGGANINNGATTRSRQSFNVEQRLRAKVSKNKNRFRSLLGLLALIVAATVLIGKLLNLTGAKLETDSSRTDTKTEILQEDNYEHENNTIFSNNVTAAPLKKDEPIDKKDTSVDKVGTSIDKSEETKTPPEEKVTTESKQTETEAANVPAPSETNVEDEKWGHWKFFDGDKENRPKEDYCSKYPNKDVSFEDFPSNAWQADAVYVNHFLDEAEKLVHRAQEAIFEEYGHGQPRTPEQSVEAHKMFHVSLINITSESPSQDSSSQGGWTTKRSYQALAKRLTHAMMTKDTFTVVMGGHSAAAGHGNHFKQSYMMQFHHVMEPVFEKLGMKLITRNMGQGGLGTLQNALGSQSIYGDEIDVIIWDSHMTEGSKSDFDLFCRQALLGSKRAPFILGIGAEFEVLKMLHEAAGADVGGLGSGMSGVPETTDEVQVNSLPWAAQFLNCVSERKDLCNSNKYRTQCWVEREDVIPPVKQDSVVGGQASWHPGFRQHQLTGRVLAFFILSALDDALEKWSEKTITEGHPLANEHWHMSDYYNSIQQNVIKMPPSFCEEGSVGRFPSRLCKVSLKARTQYTPRADPGKTSIVSILKPTNDGYIPSVAAPLYEGDDLPNPSTIVPEGAIDVRAILSQRRRGMRDLLFQEKKSSLISKKIDSVNENRRVDADKVSPGFGWVLHSEPSGFCDGSYYSQCGRQNSSKCLLAGHNDGRGGILGDGLSGWLVMSLEGLKEGIIMLNFDFWHGKNPRTEGWTELHDGKRRILNGDGDLLPNSTLFEYSINGNLITWDLTQLLDHDKVIQRVVQWMVLLDDEEMAISEKVENIELALRLNGCGRECSLSVNHVYWA